MKREEDLISILLKETYGQISPKSNGDGVSLSEYFQKKQDAPEAMASCSVQLYSSFARIQFSSDFLDIPFGLGIVEKEMFAPRETLRPEPLSDFTWMKILTERFSKRISWMAYSSTDNLIFFLTREEAEGLAIEIETDFKIAA